MEFNNLEEFEGFTDFIDGHILQVILFFHIVHSILDSDMFRLVSSGNECSKELSCGNLRFFLLDSDPLDLLIKECFLKEEFAVFTIDLQLFSQAFTIEKVNQVYLCVMDLDLFIEAFTDEDFQVIETA